MNKLERMLEQAEHEIVLMNDSDISVESDYLRQVVRPLRDPRTGLVTCLYRGVPAGGIVSILESLGISGDFAGQVLLARSVKGVRFALGATLVTRKKQIAEIGGLAPWADYLADDYILGNKIAAAGYPVHLSHTVVDTTVPRRSFFEMFRHQLRWARTIRFFSPRGYPGTAFDVWHSSGSRGSALPARLPLGANGLGRNVGLTLFGSLGIRCLGLPGPGDSEIFLAVAHSRPGGIGCMDHELYGEPCGLAWGTFPNRSRRQDQTGLTRERINKMGAGHIFGLLWKRDIGQC